MAPHSTQRPLSRLHTSSFTEVGMTRVGSTAAASVPSPGDSSEVISSLNLNTRRPPISSAQESTSRKMPLKTQIPVRTFGFTAQGSGPGRGYTRRPASFAPEFAFAFDGIGPDEVIGDIPALVNEHGAGGLEVDRADGAVGTPRRAVVLATADGFTHSYQHVVEEVRESDSARGGSRSPLVPSDIVFLEYPKGGAVFSVGSIMWCSCLSYNGYDNNVSVLTGDVLRSFASESWQPPGSPEGHD